jgi:hypothetical protein
MKSMMKKASFAAILFAAGKINQDPTLGTTGQELLTDAEAATMCLNNLLA